MLLNLTLPPSLGLFKDIALGESHFETRGLPLLDPQLEAAGLLALKPLNKRSFSRTRTMEDSPHLW